MVAVQLETLNMKPGNPESKRRATNPVAAADRRFTDTIAWVTVSSFTTMIVVKDEVAHD